MCGIQLLIHDAIENVIHRGQGLLIVCHFNHNSSHNMPSTLQELSEPRLNIKTVLSTYGDFHVKDKTAVRTSYL